MHHVTLPLVAAAATAVMASPVAQAPSNASPIETRRVKIVNVVADPVAVSAHNDPHGAVFAESLESIVEKVRQREERKAKGADVTVPPVVLVERDDEYDREYEHAMKHLEKRRRCTRCPGL